MTQEIDTPVLDLEECIQEECISLDCPIESQKNELSPEEKAAIYHHAKRIIEALLFCSDEPITLRRMSNALQTYHSLDKGEIKQLIDELAAEYIEQNRAFRLEEIAKGYIFRTCEEYSPYIHALLKTGRPEKLSHAAAEVLAIIAFRQPITRPQIDQIRGVDSSGIIATLIERQLIESTGNLEVPGRPTLFGVTKNFLKYFGLKDINELPDMGRNLKIPLKPEAKETKMEEESVEKAENELTQQEVPDSDKES